MQNKVAMPGENSNRPVRAETDVTRWLLHKFQAKISCDGDDFHNHVTLIAAVTGLWSWPLPVLHILILSHLGRGKPYRIFSISTSFQQHEGSHLVAGPRAQTGTAPPALPVFSVQTAGCGTSQPP
ncbi:uncharacterized protein RBU33_013931 isoform 2-T6 [Hipposideros larvatus]